jgi:hypothetical protein
MLLPTGLHLPLPSSNSAPGNGGGRIAAGVGSLPPRCGVVVGVATEVVPGMNLVSNLSLILSGFDAK